jgi:hypothetical protein|tara:strand:+ start:1374 stop:2408 length:1035 start_codon:yes stop_codon:yes gene_type:complete
MITTIKLSNKFIKSITLEDFLNNQNITRFFTELIKDEYVYLIWDKEYFTTLYKKYKDFLNSSNFNKHIRIFTALKNKVQYLNNDIPIDIYLISNSEKNIDKSYFNLKQINRVNYKIKKQIKNIQDEAFRITLKRNQPYDTTIRSEDVKKVQRKFYKMLFVSNEILIYDKYIGSNFVFFNKRFNEIRVNNKADDYGLTLSFLNKKIFKHSPLQLKCKIYTISKQDKLFFEDVEKNLPLFKECTKKYINNAIGTSCTLFLKKHRNNDKISEDFWKEAHDRSFVFKRDNEFIAHLNLDVGLDFIKKISPTLNKYTFTPGKRLNFEKFIQEDLNKIIDMSSDMELKVA